MSLLYKIRNFDASFGQILVQYYLEDNSFNFESTIDLPVKDGKYPEGDELSNLINNLAPNWHFERINTIKTGVSNSSLIDNLVEPYPVVNFNPAVAADIESLTDEELQLRAAKLVLEKLENPNNN